MSEKVVEASKRRQNNHGKLTWEEKVALCKRWKVSGLTKSKFCEKQSLVISTFCEWCNRVWSRSNKLNNILLTPVRINQKPEMEQQIIVELFLPNQTTARMSLPLTSIGSLIKEFYYATATLR